MATPRSDSNADARDRRIAVWIALGFLLLYLPFQTGRFQGTDEVSVYATTRALFLHGGMQVRKQPHAYPGRDGLYYSQFAVGQSVLAIPFYAAGHLARRLASDSLALAVTGPNVDTGDDAIRFAGDLEIFAVSHYAPVASALLLALFYLLSRGLGVSRRSAVATTLLLGTCTYVAAMSTYFLRHTTETALVLGALLAFRRYAAGGGVRHLVWGSLAVSSLLLVRVPSAVAGPALFGYALAVVHGRRRDGAAELGCAAAALAVPLLAALAIHVAVNQIKWGTWLESPMLGHRRIVSWPPYAHAMRAFLWSPGISLFVYSPLLLVTPLAFASLWRARRTEAVTLVALGLSFFVLASSFRSWTGLYSAPGPRYLFALTPLFALSVGFWLDAPGGRWRRWVVGVTAALGAAVTLALLLAPWGGVVYRAEYMNDRTKSFLWDLDRSPIVECARSVADGQLGSWLWRFARGFRDIPAHPLAVGIVLAVWALALAFCLSRLRAATREPAATPVVG